MLNEAWRLCQALQKAEILPEQQHPLIKPLYDARSRRKPEKIVRTMLRIRLSANGDVTAVESVASDELDSLRRIVNTSDGSFPVVKVNKPLLEIPHVSEIWKGLKKRESKTKLDLLSNAFSDHQIRSWSESGWQWGSSLQKAKQLRSLLEGDEIGSALVLLSVRFEKTLMNARSMNEGIGRTALQALRRGTLSQFGFDAVQQLLVGKGKDSRGLDKKIDIFLALDLDDLVTQHAPVYDRRTWRRVADVLPTNLAARPRERQHVAGRSAFGGGDTLLAEPFPKVKMPVLRANFPLVSMASDDDKAKCNRRYGLLTEYTVVPVTKAEALRMKDALDWVLKKEREGRSWRGVANGKFESIKTQRGPRKVETEDLLIVFVDEKPDLDAKTASYFAPTPDIIEANFESNAKAVCEALDGVARERPLARLQLFLIRKATDGQAQIALAESPTVQDVISAADRWQKAVNNNLPSVTLRLPPNDKGAPPVEGRPQAPYPDQVVRLLSYQWVRDGSSPKKQGKRPQEPKQPVVGPALAEVLFLMLRTDEKWESAANRLLSMLVQRLTPLLIGVFGAARAFGPRRGDGKPEPLDDYPRESRASALQAVAVLGILLNAFDDSRKEVYMRNAPYQVGQILALADTLHKDYCIVVRKGSLPTTLIGTSFMRRALDSPAAAFAELAERMIEYVRWAKTAEVSREWAKDDRRAIAVREARKRIRQCQPLAARLGTTELPTECNDIMKAQLLLGFLASPPTESDTKEIQEEQE